MASPRRASNEWASALALQSDLVMSIRQRRMLHKKAPALDLSRSFAAASNASSVEHREDPSIRTSRIGDDSAERGRTQPCERVSDLHSGWKRHAFSITLVQRVNHDRPVGRKASGGEGFSCELELLKCSLAPKIHTTFY